MVESIASGLRREMLEDRVKSAMSMTQAAFEKLDEIYVCLDFSEDLCACNIFHHSAKFDPKDAGGEIWSFSDLLFR